MSSLVYHSYLAIVSYVDQSDEFRLGRLSLSERHQIDVDAMRKANKSYRDLLLSAQAKIQPVSEDSIRHRESCDSIPLYEVFAARSFGHTDTWMLTICDGFDPLFTLSQQSEISFEQLSLAFCPDLVGSGMEPESLCFFETAADLIATGNKTNPSLPISAAPLLLTTRLKFNGAVKLLSGCDITGAVVRAIVNSVNRVLENASREREHPDVKQCFGDALPPPAELASLPFRCVILDTQGVAELTLVMRSNTYAIPTLLLHHLRAMTLQDLFDVQPDLEAKAGEFEKVVRENLAAALTTSKAMDHPTPGSNDESPRLQPTDAFSTSVPNQFRHNHVFASTYSTACVHGESFEEDLQSVSGHVEVELSMMVNPGHLSDTEIFAEPLEKARSLAHLETEWSLSRFHRIRLGKFDSEHRLGLTEMTCIRTSDFLKLARDVYERVQGKGERQAFRGARETGLSDLSHVLSVPIPRHLSHAPVSEQHFPLVRMLSVLSQAAGRKMIGHDEILTPAYRWFDRAQFEGGMKRLRVPKRLRDSVIYLFMNFFRCLNDPKLFDSIVDLYDAFRTFHQMVLSASEVTPRKILNAKELEEIEGFATALEDACFYRLCLTSPQHELNDMAVHFRGGLNQLLAGADVLVKTGVGLLKWIARKHQEPAIAKMLNRTRVGAITELCFAMRPACVPSKLAREFEFGIAHLKVNVGHIFHIAEFVYYIHEVGHLIQFLRRRESDVYLAMIDGHTKANDAHLLRSFSRWSREMFAESFVHQFVFNGDDELFLKHFLICHSTQPEKHPLAGAKDKASVLRERLLVAFYVVAMSDLRWTGIKSDEDVERCFSNAFDEFRELAKQCVYLHEYHQLVEDAGESFWTVLRDTCRNVLMPVHYGLHEEIAWTRNQRTAYCKAVFGLQANDGSPDIQLDERLSALDADTLGYLKSARPMTNATLDAYRSEQSNSPTTASFGPDDEALAPILLICCSMMRCFLLLTTCAARIPGRCYHVPRDAHGAIDRSRANTFAPFMIDRGFAGTFCTTAEDRGKAVQYATAVHLTLQVFSMELRRRRLLEMVRPVTEESKPTG